MTHCERRKKCDAICGTAKKTSRLCAIRAPHPLEIRRLPISKRLPSTAGLAMEEFRFEFTIKRVELKRDDWKTSCA